MMPAIENNRLFILAFHDLLLPFIKKINSLPGRISYVSRTVFFYNKGVLHPITIELSVPLPSLSINKRVYYTHGHVATKYWIWKLAKAHVCSNDAGVHQLGNHWLRTHACMEPYIIATHRQLSSMHPIYKLLHPHMRYTLEINAVAHQILINGGGIIEECFSPGKYAMELSSAAYKRTQSFEINSLGVRVEDSSMPGGVRLLIEDYPYAADGLLVWSELEIRPKPMLHISIQNTTASPPMWSSKLGGMRSRAKVTTTNGMRHGDLNYKPRKICLTAFLSSIPTQLQARKVMAVQDTLSTHFPDEEYVGQQHHLHNHWIDDTEILRLSRKFISELEEVEDIINTRNKDIRLNLG
ncbi:hypothetical protein IFM89_017389 [Coptis chinensis]|uniref:Lipoxygenase domain-containing protein n=1 Tax=Coptis chinensis TaxID=261450 RepID=A0A835HMQ5_9MAGN|nr:hypothetical protein IFM89_017389 [Coptis chinensis]